jgi:hypothetical protein
MLHTCAMERKMMNEESWHVKAKAKIPNEEKTWLLNKLM